MADGAGSGATGEGPDPHATPTWEARAPLHPPMMPVGLGAADTPTDPELPRTLEPGDRPAPATTPFFYDLSGMPSAPGGWYAGPVATTAAPPPPPFGAPGAAPTYGGPPAYGAPGYGYPYGPSPYGPYAYGGWGPPTTNGLATASMICGILALAFCQLFSIPAVIMGLIARRQIRDAAGTQTGGAFALTGIITGCISLALLTLFVLIYAGLFAFAVTA